MAATEQLIAKAIKKADSSYFFENYDKQAKAVVQALAKEGLRVVPLSPTEDMEAAGTDAIRKGRIRPSDLVRTIYEVMVKSYK